MLNVALITLAFIIIGGIQVYTLLKKKLVKEMVLTVTLLLISLFYCYNETFNWALPAPSVFIQKACDPIAEIVFGQEVK